MGIFKCNQDYATQIIYNAVIDEKKEWRTNGNIHDIAIEFVLEKGKTS